MWKRIQTEFKEQIWDNEQVLKVRQKFAELDVQTQSYILIGGFASFVLLLLVTFFLLWAKAITLKSEIASMDETIRFAQNTSAKIEELKAQARNQGGDTMLQGFDVGAPVVPFVERAAQKSLIPKSNVEVSEGKADQAQLKLTKISLRQLVRILYLIEQSGASASVERLVVDSKDDPEGYLWAELLVKKARGG